LADRLYQVLDEMIGHLGESDQRGSSGDGPEQSEDVGAGPRAAEEISAQYRPITNWAFRGALDPDLVQGHTNGEEEISAKQEMSMQDNEFGGSPPPQILQDRSETQTVPGPPEIVELPQEGGSTSLEQSLQLEDTFKNQKPLCYGGQQQVFYDEWDGTIQDYRPRWCCVRERIGPEGTHEFIDQTLAAHAPVIRLLRRYFEAIRPTAFRRLGRQENGEDIDLDAVVRWVADRRIGRDPSDRVYFRREKRERQVAVAFVIDMSGSTGRHIGPGQRRVIDVEKEGLLLLSEALSAIGDQYALYGYSGQGRHQVDVVVLKAFEEASMGRAALRIGAIQPRQQNRDGAVIRHVAHRLLQQPARTRLLILISDGKPLDDGYGDEYSLEDTKMALREVRVKGIHPFCITVDQSASDYLKRMYGEIGFLVIDDIRTLPGRLPRIYQRLTA
jgi:nitric oxide reductase activation protein